ncbi:MAG: M28 family peptidase [Bacteroidales bacterium]|nr:M28 family peptidase [Bacteroidales bacterium]
MLSFMLKVFRKYALFLLLTFFLLGAVNLYAQNKAEELISKQSLKNTMVSLTDPLLKGRESGTEEIKRGLEVIADAFYDAGVRMRGESYLYGFWYWKGNERALGINAIGIIPADSSIVSPKTLVLGAHYDGLGVLGGRVYPGADNNASGVAALIEVGKALAAMTAEGKRPKCNICLVAFDAKQLECLGSSRFLSEQTADVSSISLMINLDQIGTTLAPPKEAETGELLPKNYLLFLGMDSVDESVKKSFVEANITDEPIVLDFTCYGNRKVHDMLYEMGDQTSFRDAGIPAVVITSGVHKYTNKTLDDIRIINFNALTERCKFIFRAVCKISGMAE